jgi:FKBP-type peptidyl-prolyl cis-trans isomerase
VKYLGFLTVVMTLTISASAVAAPPHARQISLPDGLRYTDTVVGRGPVAKSGEMVRVHYVGTFPNGQKFDSSRDRNEPFAFPLGAGKVIRGWDEGVAGMRVGGHRKLVVPPQLGYGAAGAGGVIPPNATLDFDIELLGIDR